MQFLSHLWGYVYESINSIDVNSINSIFRLILSLLLGSIVGYERKRKGQTAGVRTFSLIAMGATLAMLLSIYIPQEYLGLKNGDPGRVAAQVVTGVGFLGAGAIIQMKGSVRGLTTAAGIWMVATIGMAVGVGMYWVSVAATALILFILVQLERIEHRVSLGSESRVIRLTAATIIRDIKPYSDIMKKRRMHLSNFYIEYDMVAGETHLNLIVLVRENTDYLALFQELEAVYPTKNIALTNQLAI
ncbi:MAG: MgtC/SapB family protein [Muribaculaceae bacterium]|nr:MgtC/SapB family protein [Muribaculaceae bacterium]MDE7457566.1 MgtC/SapB family protein [Muribaculaceae bacterium]